MVHGDRAVFVPVLPKAGRKRLESDAFVRQGTRISCDVDSLFFAATPHHRELDGLGPDGAPYA